MSAVAPNPLPVGPARASSARLLVLEAVPHPDSKVLRTVDTITGKQLSVALCDEWMHSNVNQNDIVRVLLTRPDGSYLPWDSAPVDEQHPVFVTRDNHLFVHHPDTLVSGTSIADSFLCLRKSLLTARVPPRSILQSTGGEAALFGSMIHDLFQNLLAIRTLDALDVYESVEIILQQHLEDLYAAKISDADARLVLHNVIPSIMEWFKGFARLDGGENSAGVKVTGGKQTYSMGIGDVYDIEELVWSPIFGLKGKIDASVILCSNDEAGGIGVVELKTGSSVGYASVSHSAQVNLYNLLMSDRYSKHTKGNFTRHPNNKAVSYVRGEVVGLLMQRNEFASYARFDSDFRRLPPLLQGREDLCAKCFANDTCMIQHKLLENGSSETVKGGPGPGLFREKAMHLTDEHAAYYMFWRRVLADEEAHAARPQNEVWNMRGSQREALGRCLSNLRMVEDSAGSQDGRVNYLLPPGQRMTVTFQRHHGDALQAPLNDAALAENDFVLVSAESLNTSAGSSQQSIFTWQSALTNGFIQSTSPSSVAVVIDRSLFAWARNQAVNVNDIIWRIDSVEIHSSHNTAKRTLENLFCCDETTDLGRLRGLVVDGTRPRLTEFIIGSQSTTVLKKEFNVTLNDDQDRALQMALRTRDYLLVLGMPGTGKTTTLAAIVLAYASQGKSVLLCSHTNSAVDNLLQRLLAAGFRDFVRLGRNKRVISKAIHPYHISTLTADASTTKHLETVLEQPKVVATTCLGINHPLLLRRGRFDLVVVDEASQVLQPICLGPLQFAAGPFILVGDHYQLPPLLRAQQANESIVVVRNAMDASQACNGTPAIRLNPENQRNESLFRRLCEFHPEAMISLSQQYRMSSEIMRLSNELVYSGSLSCGSEEIANQRLVTSLAAMEGKASWLQAILDQSRAVIFLDMPEDCTEDKEPTKNPEKLEKLEASRRNNLREAGVVCKCVSALEQGNGMLDTNVYTIDQYQGRDSDCVIVSFVRCSGSVGPLLKDWRRVNVALTRAKQKLILVGCSKTLAKGSHFLRGMITLLENTQSVVPVS
ncbi:unnamed protein product [Chondrus crispus]|uniref:DNA replication ATP-dependent helicase/nuclease n=1 Tax=Chondrus crispus TaxID=2769 RepID=R7QU31_CHOCR|nr:unnamed protein product [Chondrus crispus]CDF41218.1 unnamed protein product [Chondrus crispus]|eukprot:XP_005711512.1 unnamed protein product [Chondrus crispus]